MMKSHNIAWTGYLAFVLIAIIGNGEESSFVSSGLFPLGKYLTWALFLGFTAYTFNCSRNESLFRTMKVMQGLYWGRQIGIDLYIGLFLFIGLIGFHQGSLVTILLWAIPVLAFGNLATLLYVALHYDTLIELLH